MIDRFIGKISRDIIKSEKDEQEYKKYAAILKTPGWQWYLQKIMLLKGHMAEELLSERFSQLPSAEKDARQRAYSGISVFLDFLMNPLLPAAKHIRLVRHAKKQEATRREATKTKEK